MLENTEEAIKNGQSRETDNIYIVHKAKTSDTKQSRLESTTEITQYKHVKVLHYFVDDIKLLK
jgi:uncharacterized protein YdeI (YjbR/CyaY-like superfamily)